MDKVEWALRNDHNWMIQVTLDKRLTAGTAEGLRQGDTLNFSEMIEEKLWNYLDPERIINYWAIKVCAIRIGICQIQPGADEISVSLTDMISFVLDPVWEYCLILYVCWSFLNCHMKNIGTVKGWRHWPAWYSSEEYFQLHCLPSKYICVGSNPASVGRIRITMMKRIMSVKWWVPAIRLKRSFNPSVFSSWYRPNRKFTVS